MKYSVEKMVRDVRVALDLNQDNRALAELEDVDTLSADEIIRSTIEEAVRRVHKSAPYHMLELGHQLPQEPIWGELESGWVPLPDDFMRLVVFRMSDWSRSVYAPLSPDDPRYAQTSSRIKAIRGTADRPVCVIGVRPEGKVLEYYSCRSENATVASGVYIPEPRIDSEGYIDISERCYRSAVYTSAMLSAAGVLDADRMKILDELAKTNLQ